MTHAPDSPPLTAAHPPVELPARPILPVVWLDKESLCTLLGIERRSLERKMRAGLPFIALGPRCIRFDLDRVREWLERNFGQSRRGRSREGERRALANAARAAARRAAKLSIPDAP